MPRKLHEKGPVQSQIGAQLPDPLADVGNGFDPEDDLSYSVYLADQIRRSGLQEHLHVMETTPLAEEIYKAQPAPGGEAADGG